MAVVGVPLGDRVQKDDSESRENWMFLVSERNILRGVDEFGRESVEELHGCDPWRCSGRMQMEELTIVKHCLSRLE
jgi:hypothetical protein